MKSILSATTLVVLFGTYQVRPNSHTYSMCNPGWTRGAGKAPVKCQDNVPDYEAGLCYQDCDKGYHGIGPICWEKCKDGEIDDGATCRVPLSTQDWYDRGAGRVPKSCGEGRQYQAGLCYTDCKPGYKGTATMCYQQCPGGYKDIGLICTRHITDWFSKKSYGRGVGKPPKCCPNGQEYIAGLCYPQPKKGYSCVATHCRECYDDCPDKPKTRGPNCGNNSPPKAPVPPKKPCTPGNVNVLSVDHKSGQHGKYFNFDKKELDAILGRTNWSGNKLDVGNGKQVVVWRNANGGSKGDAHGRLEKTDKVGDWSVGDKINFRPMCPSEQTKDLPKDDGRVKLKPGIRSKGTHTRNVGVIPSKCDAGDEKLVALCYPKCGPGYWGDVIFCRSNNFREHHFPSLEHSLPSVKDVMDTCSLDLVVDTILSANDFDNIQFGAADMDKCLMENVNKQLDDQWDQQTAVTAIEIDMAVTEDGRGLLQHVMSLSDIEFDAYDAFKGSCSKHGNADALDKFDGFLRWFYDEVKVQHRDNVYVGIAFQAKPPSAPKKQPMPGCDATCGCGYRFSTQDVNGDGKEFTSPGKGIDNCARACSERDGCTGFEYNYKGNHGYKCGTYTGGDILNGERAGVHLDWQTCLRIVDEKVPFPPKPADQQNKGLDVYFYYGVCEGGKVSIGSNTVVYRSVDDITTKRQVYAPFNDLKFGDKVNVNSMYGLSENGCSLNYMGVSLDSKKSKNWFDWDGHECKAEGIVRLN